MGRDFFDDFLYDIACIVYSVYSIQYIEYSI